MSRALEHNEVETNGRQSPRRGRQAQRADLLGPRLHSGSLDFILSVLGTHCRF